MGKYHPHGDVGDLRRDGAPGAAVRDARARSSTARATSARSTATRPRPCATPRRACRPLAGELLGELGRRTVEWRPNYDGTTSEPIVLPARFPNLLVNGSQGIAVGMATSIPPHNLGEVVDACVALINQEDLPVDAAPQVHQGPRLPDRRPAPRDQRRSSRRSTRAGRARSSSAASGSSRATTASEAASRRRRSICHQRALRGRAQGDRREDRRDHHRQEARRAWSTCATSRPPRCASSSS